MAHQRAPRGSHGSPPYRTSSPSTPNSRVPTPPFGSPHIYRFHSLARYSFRDATCRRNEIPLSKEPMRVPVDPIVPRSLRQLFLRCAQEVPGSGNHGRARSSKDSGRAISAPRVERPARAAQRRSRFPSWRKAARTTVILSLPPRAFAARIRVSQASFKLSGATSWSCSSIDPSGIMPQRPSVQRR